MGCVPPVFKEEVVSVQKQEVFRPNWQEVPKLTMVNVRLSKISDGPAKTMHYGGAWARSCSVEHLLGMIHEEPVGLDTAASQISFLVCPSLRKAALGWQVSRLHQVLGEKEAKTGSFSPTLPLVRLLVSLHPEKSDPFWMSLPMLSLWSRNVCGRVFSILPENNVGYEKPALTPLLLSDHLKWLKCPMILIMQIHLIEPFRFKFYTALVFKSATAALMGLSYFVQLSRSTDLNCSISEDYEGKKIKSTDG